MRFESRASGVTAFAASAVVVMLTVATRADERREPVDFNRDVRPILSNKCFLCHGPDEEERKADLRLDTRDGALAAIVPGEPQESELIVRVVAEDDPSSIMPPRKSGAPLTSDEVEILTRWIQEGAKYAVHWAYQKPVQPSIPEVQGGDLIRNPIDAFLLEQLESQGLSFSPEADRRTLARRAALDLTGLPPTPEELDAFLADDHDGAYDRYVDRLLAKSTYGEHWARLWLDLARYADSAGYADDPVRTIWAYRDYVIRSFNDDKPFDRFTIEQIAGDLLPDPTEDQLIATAFHRNTMTNNEGGTNDEEFRNVAVVDRVNTTWTVWMGTSMACAQCHTHKYDPITQAEYFQSFAFFNNTQDADRPDESPVLPIESAEQKQSRIERTKTIARLETELKTTTPELQSACDRWGRDMPRELPWRTVPSRLTKLFESDKRVGRTDEIPLDVGMLSALRLTVPSEVGTVRINQVEATLTPPVAQGAVGRYVRIELPGAAKILSLAEVQVFRDDENLARKGEASQSSTAFNGPAGLAVDGNTDGDYNTAQSTTHTEESDSPWWEVDLKTTTPIDRIAVWNRTDNGTDARLTRFRIIVLDDARNVVWERVIEEAPQPTIAMEPNNHRSIRLEAAKADETTNAGSIGWTLGGEPDALRELILLPVTPVDVEPGSTLVLTMKSESGAEATQRVQIDVVDHPRAAEFAKLPDPVLSALQVAEEHRTDADRAVLSEHYLSFAPELQATREQVAGLRKELAEMKPETTVPIQQELPPGERRVTRVHLRGNFEDLGETVEEGTPEAFPPLNGEVADRVALARWLVSPENPLTARVVANRYWEQIFGVGLVRTSEEFGAQGELPSHPELLDWLAVELQARNWSPKEFLRLLVRSAAYRQSSQATPELLEKDPDNRFYGRGPRFRVSAEVVRDQALFVSGLLSSKMYGPPVNPPRPATGLSAAFGSAIDRQASTGADRYRRGLYVEWRRTNPYPSMTTFDAPNRDVCTVRRNRTNTPLQALVTLNDPVYVEAAQALARRLTAGAVANEDRARLGVSLCFGRPATDAEVERLVELFDDAREEYSQKPDDARAMATIPLGPAPEGTPEVDLAAWSVVANVLLNLDEMFLKR